jgi:hypothetical protein
MAASDGHYFPDETPLFRAFKNKQVHDSLSLHEAVDELLVRDTARHLREWEAKYNRLMELHHTVKDSIAYVSSEELKNLKLKASTLEWENQKLRRMLLTQMY